MHLDKYVVGLALFILIVGLGAGIIAGVQNAYDDQVNMSIDEYLDFTEDQYQGNTGFNESEAMHAAVLDQNELPEAQVEDSMFKGGFTGTRGMIISSGSITKKLINNIALDLGLPDELVTAFITIITIMVAFAVVFLIFRLSK